MFIANFFLVSNSLFEQIKRNEIKAKPDLTFFTSSFGTSTERNKNTQKITMKAYTFLAVIFVAIYACSAYEVSAGMGKHKGNYIDRLINLLKIRINN